MLSWLVLMIEEQVGCAFFHAKVMEVVGARDKSGTSHHDGTNFEV